MDIETRLRAMEEFLVKKSGYVIPTDPIPTPTPAPTPKPIPTPAVTIGSNLITPTGVVNNYQGWFKTPQDGKGARHIVGSNNITLDTGGSFANGFLTTGGGNGFAVTLKGKGARLSNVVLDPEMSGLAYVSGENSIVKNCTATTFRGYAFFAERAKNFTLKGLKVDGGSIYESLVRFEGTSTGQMSDCNLNYTTSSRKACIRGSLIGSIKRVVAKGAIVGINPLEGDDAGQVLGIWKFAGAFPGGTVDAINIAECFAVVADAKAKGVKSNADVIAAVMKVAKVVVDGKTYIANAAPKITSIDNMVKSRAAGLANKTDVELEDTDWGRTRWAANTRLNYNRGILRANSDGVFFDGPHDRYPSEDKYVLPEDIMRSKPDITFSNFYFESKVKPLSEFMAEIQKYGVKLNNCQYNGIKI